MAYVAADYWQIEYTEGELIVLSGLPSSVSTSTGLTYSSLEMAGSGYAESLSYPLLTAQMSLECFSVVQSLGNASANISTAIAGNPFVYLSSTGITYSQLDISANVYAVAVSPANLKMAFSLSGQANSSAIVSTDYTVSGYWLDNYVELTYGSSLFVDLSMSTNAKALALSQSSLYSQMSMSANAAANSDGFASARMTTTFMGRAYTQSTGNGQVFSTVYVMTAPKALATAKARKITFVGYNLPIGINAIDTLTPNYTIASLTEIHTLIKYNANL